MLNDELLEERLHRDLDRVQPGAVPLEELIGHGRMIKARRRAGFAAGLAAVAAVAVGVPVAVSGGGSSGVSAGAQRTVLASGTVDGQEWSFVTGGPLAKGCGASFVTGTWTDISIGTCLGLIPVPTDPAFLRDSGAGPHAPTLFIAQLRPDVDRVTVTGTDDTVQTPTVAEVSGHRYAFFAVPAGQGIARLDAYAADGTAIAYTLPYRGPDNTPPGVVESWYPAGATPTQAAVRRTLFSDSTAKPLTVTVDMGPFGVCYWLSGPQEEVGLNYGPDCHSVTPPAPTDLFPQSYVFGERRLLLGEVNNAVDHVDATLSDGSTARLTPVRVGGHSFVVTYLATGVQVRETKAFDASGAQLADTR